MEMQPSPPPPPRFRFRENITLFIARLNFFKLSILYWVPARADLDGTEIEYKHRILQTNKINYPTPPPPPGKKPTSAHGLGGNDVPPRESHGFPPTTACLFFKIIYYH